MYFMYIFLLLSKIENHIKIDTKTKILEKNTLNVNLKQRIIDFIKLI